LRISPVKAHDEQLFCPFLAYSKQDSISFRRPGGRDRVVSV
jgi:hypothetical protein